MSLFQRQWPTGVWRPFYPLLLNSMLATLLVVIRIWACGYLGYSFLVWNLALAWVPYVASLLTYDLYRRGARWSLLLPGVTWLVFLPNAPYLITDFMHLREYPPIPIWYDAVLMMTFAWSGSLLGIASLRTMQQIIARLAGYWLSWLFVALSALLSGFGVYLGRFQRWNSWDLLFAPRGVWSDVLVRLASPLDHPQTLTVTLLFATLIFVCYVTALSLSQLSKE